MNIYSHPSSLLRRFLVLPAVLLAWPAVNASQVIQFTDEPREGLWENVDPVWKSVQGTWYVSNVNGTSSLRSEALNPETGNITSSYFYLDLDRSGMHSDQFVIKFRITDVASVPHGSVAFYVSFTQDSPAGQHPKTLFTIAGVPAGAPGQQASGNFNFRIQGEQLEGEPKSEAELASAIATEEGVTIKIKVDPAANTATATIDGWPESEPITLRQPWSDVRFIRVFQRGLSLVLSPIEATQ